MFKTVILAAIALACVSSNAEARQRHKTYVADPGCNVIFPCEGVAPSARGQIIADKMKFGAPQKVYTPRVSSAKSRDHISNSLQTAQNASRRNGLRGPLKSEPSTYANFAPEPAQRVASVPSQVIGGRPAGCPHAFCGCGASLHLFGKIIPSLNLAANWLRFPRAAPAPQMAAARSGHVMVLEQHIAGNVWLVHDSNSGGHLTRLHARSIAGYTVVNPHTSRYASAL